MIFQVECRIVMKSLTSCPITLLQVHLWDLVLIVQIPMLLPYARAFSNPFLPLPPQTFCLMVEWKGDQKLALTKRQKWYVTYISSYTVFEIHRKSLIQHCLRSNSVTRPVNFKSQKWVKIETFWLIFKQCVLIVFYVLIIVS